MTVRRVAILLFAFVVAAPTSSPPVNVPIQIFTQGAICPVTVTITPSSTVVRDDSTAGTVLANFSVKMSDGSVYGGTTTSSNALISISGANLVLSRDLTPADDGVTTTTVNASTCVAYPAAISFSPTSVSVPDDSTTGTILATVSVTMSDGSPFAGTITSSNSLISVSGMNLILSRDLTPADDGSPAVTISATQ